MWNAERNAAQCRSAVLSVYLIQTRLTKFN